MDITESYIRSRLRQVYDPEDVFHHENVFLANERGVIIGLNLANVSLSDLSSLLLFKELKFLDLNDNQIVNATPLGQLKQLEKIDLAFNQVDDLTFTAHLPKLVFLDIRSNRVSRLPYSMAQMTIPILWEYQFKQWGIILEGNPLEIPPVAVIKRGQDDIQAYLQSLQGGEEKLGELKVIVLGGGRAGKTSLVRQICGEPFRQDETVTQGINLRMRVTAPGSSVRIHIWDFGGQELMYSTHAFFLTHRAVYLIVLDGRREERAEYWLKQIQIVADNSPVFVIINKIDENPFYDLDRAELRRKWPNIEGFHALSCKTKEGLAQFLDFFWGQVGEYELPKLVFSKQWLAVKDRLLSHQEPFVDHSWYVENCIENRVVDPDQQRALLNCLNDLGLVLHFPGFLLGDFVVLNPHWLTAGIYSLINDEEGKKQGGILNANDVDHALEKMSDEFHYSREGRRFIIDLMKQFEICFEIDQDRLLIPDLLPREQPDIPATSGRDSHLIIIFDFLPLSVFHRVVVRLRTDIKDNLLWRTGVVLFDPTLETVAVVRIDQEGSRLSILTSGKRKREYLAIVRWITRNAIKVSGRIAAIEYIRLPGDIEYLVPYAKLTGLRDKGIDQYPHEISDQVFSIADLLSNVEITADMTNENIATKGKSAGEADEPYCFVAYASQDRTFVERLSEKLRAVGIPLWYDQHLQPGDMWSSIIESKILGCAAFIVIVSPDSRDADFVRREIAMARRCKKPLIPIQLRHVNDWLDIANEQWLDSSNEAEMIRKLYTSLTRYMKVKKG